ncbi:hypothetical protein OH77DRAFT_864148 [Trametes cingulata]|nr:hypothetical protein OH77DRAFT_864148 [Trametes cingulata]
MDEVLSQEFLFVADPRRTERVAADANGTIARSSRRPASSCAHHGRHRQYASGSSDPSHFVSAPAGDTEDSRRPQGSTLNDGLWQRSRVCPSMMLTPWLLDACSVGRCCGRSSHMQSLVGSRNTAM